METLYSIDELNKSLIRTIYYKDNKIVGSFRDSEGDLIEYDVVVPLLELFILICNDKNHFYVDDSVEELFDEKFFSENVEKIFNQVNKFNFALLSSDSVFDFCLKNKKYDVLLQSSYFDTKFSNYINSLDINNSEYKQISEYIDDLANSFGDNIPRQYCFSRLLSESILKSKNVVLFSKFSKGVIKSYNIDEFVPYFEDFYKNLDYVPYYLYSSQSYFDFVRAKKDYQLLCEFSSSLISEDVISEYESDFEKLILETNEVPSGLNDKTFVRDFLYKNKCFKLLVDMDIPPLIEYFDAEEFYNFFINCNEFGAASESKQLLEYFLNKKDYNFIRKCFDRKLFDTEICLKYIDMFETDFSIYLQAFIKLEYEVLEKFLTSDKILNTPVGCFSEDDLFKAMNDYSDEMVKLILHRPEKFFNNYSALYLFFVYGLFDNMNFFDSDLFDEQIAEDFWDDILNYLNSCDFLPFVFRNKEFVDYVIKIKAFDLFIRFPEDILTVDVVEEYANELLEVLNGEFPLFFENNVLFEKSIELGFMKEAVTYRYIQDEHVRKYFNDFCKYSLTNGVPKVLKENSYFAAQVLKYEIYGLVDQFDNCAFDFEITVDIYDSLIKYIDQYNKGIVPSAFLTNDSFRSIVYDNQREDLFMQCVMKIDDKHTLEFYASKLNIDSSVLNEKVKYLYARNDELFNTVLPRMFEERMNVIDFRHLEKIMLYADLQSKLLQMTDNQLKVMSKVFDVLDSDDYDMSGVIVSIINNLSLYDNLINDIDFNKITQDELVRLLSVLSRKDNLYAIACHEDLKEENYNELKKYYFSVVTKRIKDNVIPIEELKEALFQKKFGLSMEQVKFLVERYCHSLESLNNDKFDKKLRDILVEINNVYNSNDFILLKYLYIRSKTIEVSFFGAVSLESSIRQNFASIYSDTLYKIKSDHKVEKNTDLKENNPEIYSKLNNVSYEGNKIPVYIMDGDFRLQIHALGAYREWNLPDNFKDDWVRPKISYHGICTSYIANNQIANARARHPILGFDNYSSDSLLCAGNYDLFSDNAISRYDSSMYDPYRFFLPDDMINNTRHSHNEMVIERRGKGNFKRLPNYLVYLVDDINIESNFEGELWDEYRQAANDYNVPIVIVDRLKYAKSEMHKIEELEQEFYKTYDASLLHDIVLQFCNNMIGCIQFSGNPLREYNKIFSQSSLEELMDRILNNILAMNNENLKNYLIKMFYLELKLESMKGSEINFSSKFAHILKDKGIDVGNKTDQFSNSFELEKIINDYYYSSSEEVQERIETDLNNNVDLEIIVSKINNGDYERKMKL